MLKTYSELSKLKTRKERFEYLKIGGKVGEETFGWDRYINQKFYTSDFWKKLRNDIIVRDMGRDAVESDEIKGTIIIHHLNPITKDDIINLTDAAINPEYLVCVSHNTHLAIHYGDEKILKNYLIVRSSNDTCPWKK